MNDDANIDITEHFELDPFVSEIARWLDKEVLALWPEFKTIDIADRAVRICSELRRRGAVVMIKPGPVSVWVMTASTKKRTGGSEIAVRSRFVQSSHLNASLAKRFERNVKKHAKSRLAAIVEITEALFRLCNDGKLEIIGVDAHGIYLWGPPLATRIASGDPRGENCSKRFPEIAEEKSK